ncbi:MAG: right-handed parallel beta-helix repeat-containing protein [Candidatus Thermoplasmatota archaeon]|nr:right-handed parallel beta-helix repeat-containing protein [Candidatus Thermoplasmatota archaeon]
MLAKRVYLVGVVSVAIFVVALTVQVDAQPGHGPVWIDENHNGVFDAGEWNGTSIQDAVDNASTGDIIVVEPGIYNETVDVTLSDLTLRANATNPSYVIVNANGTADHVFYINGQTNVTIEGFTICGAQEIASYQHVAGIYMINSRACTITNNIIVNISHVGTHGYAHGIYMQQSQRNYFDNLLIHNISSNDRAYGLNLFIAANNSFSATVIEAIKATGSYAYGTSIDAYSNNNTFNDTTIQRVHGTEFIFGLYVAVSENNTFTDTSISHVTGSGTVHGLRVYASSHGHHFTNTIIENISGTLDTYGILFTFNDYLHNLISTSIRNVTSVNEDAFGMCLYSRMNTINGTHISQVTAANHSYGLFMEDGYNTFMDLTVVNITSGNTSVGVYVGSPSNRFNFTDIINITAPYGDAYGIYIDDTYDNIFRGHTKITGLDPLADFDIFGIYIFSSYGIDFHGDINISCLQGNAYGYGICLRSSYGNDFYGNIILWNVTLSSYAAGYGIYLISSNDNVFYGAIDIKKFEVVAGDGYGVYLQSSHSNFFTGNITIPDFDIYYDAYGVYLEEASWNNFTGCINLTDWTYPTGMSFGVAGIYLNNSHYNTFEHGYISELETMSGLAAGIFGNASHYNTFNDITLCYLTEAQYAAGIYVNHSVYTAITNCHIYNTSHGIWVGQGSNHTAITGDRIYNNTVGIYIWGGTAPYDNVNTSIHYSYIYNNDEEGLIYDISTGATPYINATWNWWGTGGKPGSSHQTMVDPVTDELANGGGDELHGGSVDDNIHFDPWIGKLSLYAGWNLVTVPLENISITSTDELASVINTQAGFTVCTVIVIWDGQHQQYLSHVVGISQPLSLVPGQGYFVFMLADFNATIEGMPEPIVNIALKTGYNLLGWTKIRPINASELVSHIDNARKAASWNDSGQEWLPEYIAALAHKDFFITAGDGVFVFVNEGTDTWNGS